MGWSRLVYTVSTRVNHRLKPAPVRLSSASRLIDAEPSASRCLVILEIIQCGDSCWRSSSFTTFAGFPVPITFGGTSGHHGKSAANTMFFANSHAFEHGGVIPQPDVIA